MADDLEPIRQVFDADLEPYIHEMQSADHSIDDFVAQNRLAIEALSKVRDDAIRAGYGMQSLADHEDEAARAAAAAAAAEAEQAAELGHLRDNAAEAAHEVRHLGDASAEARARMDLMGLSGASTIAKISPMVGLIGALVGTAAAVSPAFAAAGLGFAAFGAVAKGALSQVMPAVQAYQQALNTTGKMHTRAMTQYMSYYNALSGTQKQLVGAINSIAAAWQNFVQNSTPAVTRVITAFSKVIPTIFGIMQQFIGPMTGILVQMAGSINRALNSIGFKQFISTMLQLLGPAIAAIQGLAGALLGLLGHALIALAPLAVPLLNMITGLVRALSGPLIALLGVFQSLLFTVLKAIQPLLPGLSRLATLLIQDVGAGLNAIIPVLGQVIALLGPVLLQILLALEPVLANLLTPNSGFVLALKLIPDLLRMILPLFTALASILAHPMFATLAADAITIFVAFKALVAVLGLLRTGFLLLTAAMEVNPIMMIITVIGLLVLAFIALWQHSAGFRDFWKGLWADIQRIMAPVVGWIHNSLQNMSRWWSDHGAQVMRIVHAAWAYIAGIVKIYMALTEGEIKVGLALIRAVWNIVWGIIKDVVVMNWRVIRDITTTTIHTIHDIIMLVMDIIEGHWSAAWHMLQHIAAEQMHMIANVIRDVASGFIHLLYDAGRNIIQGLINGVTSMIGAVTNIIGSIGHAISGAFSSVLHIFSPSGVFFGHGRNTMLGWINGVLAMLPTARAVMAQAAATMMPQRTVPSQLFQGYGASAPAPSSPGVGGAAAGGGPQTVVVNVDGRKLFEVMQGQTFWYNVRNSGHITGVVRPV